MTLSDNPQTSFEEIPIADVIGDGETRESLKCAIKDWASNKDAAARFNKAKRTIIALTPFDGTEKTYRVDQYTLSSIPTAARPRAASDGNPGHRVKIGGELT